MLDKWENAVMIINADGQVWKATKFSFICSNHFEYQDYIIPPSSDRTCRLKKYAIPSVFSKLEKPNAINLSNEERNRLGISRKHFPVMTQMTWHRKPSKWQIKCP